MLHAEKQEGLVSQVVCNVTRTGTVEKDFNQGFIQDFSPEGRK